MTDSMTDLMKRDGHEETDPAHRAQCAECAALWAELEAIGAEARTLPRLSPSRDLWAGIDARLAPMPGTERDSLAAPARLRIARRWHQHPAVRLATAASLLVAATATVTWQVATRGNVEGVVPGVANGVPSAAEGLPAATVAQAPTAQGAAPGGAAPDLREAFGQPTDVVGQVQQASLDRTVQSMDREIADLQKLLDGRRATLDPRTVQVLEQNLKVIDAAIAESRQALAADPASRFLAAQYARAYTSKLTLLRGVATLPAGD